MSLEQRKTTRLKEYDYSLDGAYFITICTKNRRQILSRGGVPPPAIDAIRQNCR